MQVYNRAKTKRKSNVYINKLLSSRLFMLFNSNYNIFPLTTVSLQR